MTTIGIIHPGKMGIFVAATITESGYEVCWASHGRSVSTQRRAEEYQLVDVGDMESLCRCCQVLISVCPPHAAVDVAKEVLDHSFTGLYLDANAISPAKVKLLARLFEESDVGFVDGGIIGRPDWRGQGTQLYIAGSKSKKILPLFTKGPLQIHGLEGEIGSASALKMCYAAYTKGTTALLAGILAVAEDLDVRQDLETRWEMDWPGLVMTSQKRVSQAAKKAWRFEHEMQEISDTFEEAGLPGDFHMAAKEIYSRLGGFKDFPDSLEFKRILESLLRKQ